MMRSHRLGCRTLCFLSCLLLAFTSVAARAQQQKAASQITSQISGAIDVSQTTTIPHSTHPLIRGAVDQGAVSADQQMNHMLLVLQPSAERQAALKKFIDDQQNPSSASYHHWLTPAQFGAQFGPSQEDAQAVVGWLTGQGMTVTRTSTGGGWIDFSGSVATVNQTFKTSMRRYQINGATHIANATDISIPTALTALVKGVVRLNDFYMKTPVQFSERVQRQSSGKMTITSYDGMRNGVAAGSSSHPVLTDGSGDQDLTPGDLAQIYDAASLVSGGTDGTGMSIAVIGRSNVQLSDMREFRQLFGLPANDPQIILVGPDPGTGSEDEEESALDLEYAGALAPKATIKFVTAESTDTADGIDLAATYAVDNVVAPIITVSYGECEPFLGTAGNFFDDAMWQQAAAEGISVLVAAGDSGSAGCDASEEYTLAQDGLAVNGLSSTPFDTAVGGTMFDPTAMAAPFWSTTNQGDFVSALGYVPERVWNESCDPSQPVSATGNCMDFASEPQFAEDLMSAGGGGASSCTQSTQTQNADGTVNIQCTAFYPKPTWQAGPGVPEDGARDVPDVAMAAAAAYAPYTICVEGSCEYTTDSSGNITLYDATLVGGTSAATPTFAGIVALINQTSGSFQGLLNYKLYQLAAGQNTAACNASAQTDPSQRGSCIFHDVTAGTNSVPCTGGTLNCTSTDPSVSGVLTGYNAGTGYDQASGLGSVDAANLIAAWGNISTAPSVTTLALSPTTLQHGQTVQVSGTVTAASGSAVPTGQVSLKSSTGQAFGSFALTNGAFAGSINSLPGGTYTLAASYPGDAAFSGSTSAAVSMNISAESSTTTVEVLEVSTTTGAATTGQTPNYGDPVLLRANVVGTSGHGYPTGNVTLMLDGASLGTYPVTPEGSVELDAGEGGTMGLFPGVGAHTLSATFAGDSSFSASSSQSASFTVNKGLDFTSPAGSTYTPYTGQQVLITVYVNTIDPGLPVNPSGTVQLYDNGVVIGSGTLGSSGTWSSGGSWAIIPYTFTTTGAHSLTATYAGDANYQSNMYGFPMTFNVSAPSGVASAVSVTPSSMKPVLGQGVSFSVSVTPKTGTAGAHIPTGTVTINGAITSEFEPSNTMPLAAYSALAVFNWVFTQAGNTPIYFSYSGDNYYAPSSGTILPLVVATIPAPLVLTSSATQVLAGSQVTIQAMITGSTTSNAIPFPTGQVQFYDSVNGAAAVPLGAPHTLTRANGSVAYLTAGVTTLAVTLPVGQHVITAAYPGDTNYSAEQSAGTAITVGNPDFTITSNPASLTVDTGASATAAVQVQPILGFDSAVSLSCDATTIPVGMQCAVAPAQFASGSGTAIVTLTAAAPSGSGTARFLPAADGSRVLGMSLACGFGILLVRRRRRLVAACLCAVALFCGLTALSGCGGFGMESTTLSLTSSSPKAAAGSTVTYSASVTSNGSAALTGSVTFFADGKMLGQPAALVSGVARLDSSILPVGVHTITASFNGDAHHAASQSGNFLQAITGSSSITLDAASGSLTHSLNIPIQLQ